MHLARLARLGETVPKWFAVTPQAMHDTLLHSGLAASVAAEIDKVRSDRGMVGPVAEAIKRIMLAAKMPLELKYEISQAMKQCLDNHGTIAVRGAPIGAPTGGLQESFLYQRDEEDVCRAVLGVWASGFSEAAIQNRLDQGIDPERMVTAVIVQDMIDARSSGVMTTIALEPRDLSLVHIRSLWGCGEGLVSAGLATDTFRVDKRSGESTAGVAPKAQEMVRNAETGTGLMRTAVPETRQNMRSLSQSEVTAITEAGKRIEAAYGRPQEVEFAVDTKGQVFILQTRALDAIAEDGPAAGNEIRWGRSAMMEGYNHIIPPLCFSVLRRVHHLSHLQFARAVGVPWNTIVDKQGIFPHLLGRVRGRVVHNLDQWDELVGILPSHDRYGEAIDRYTGLGSTTWDNSEHRPSALDSLLEAPKNLRSAWHLRRALTKLKRGVPRFLIEVERHLSDWRSRDLDGLRPHELMAFYREIESFVIREWETPLINDLHTIISYERLRTLCMERCRDVNGTLQNDLLCGIGGFDGTESVALLTELAQTASLQPALKQELLERSPEDLARRLPALREDEAFKEQYEELLAVYGDACPPGMRLEAVTLREDPTPVFRVLQAFLRGSTPPNFTGIRERNEHNRVEAELVVRDTLGQLQRIRFKRLLTRTRNATRNRDKLLKAQSRVYAMLRDVLLAIGRRFTNEGILREPRDVFFLTLDELRNYIQGTALCSDLQGLADLRRAEDAALATEEPPDGRFATFGMVYHRNQFKDTAIDDRKPAKILYGTGCCPGTVEGEIVLASGAADQHPAIESAILVAVQADPSWAPLFPQARALLLEQASPLSHSVILAREFGLPTITGIPGLMQRVSEGQSVRVNGTDGTVEFL